MEPEASSGWDPQTAVAIAMFLTVVVALFGESIRARLFKPKLRLTLEKPHGEEAEAEFLSPPVAEFGGIPPGAEVRREAARYYHLRVSNTRRWSPATQVQVYLLRIDERRADGQFRPRWSGEIPLLWQYYEALSPIRTIGPSRNCDLCSVVKGKWMGLHPAVMPVGFGGRYKGTANLRLLLQAQSIEADSDPVLVQIAWDGEWEDGEAEMAKHMVVSVVSGD